MNFIKNNKGTNNNHGHNPMKHILHMIICCGLPIIILLTLPLIAKYSSAAAGILGFIVPFICPVMMVGMLFMMFGKKKPSCCDEKKSRKQ
jgi:hypothetical protein